MSKWATPYFPRPDLTEKLFALISPGLCPRGGHVFIAVHYLLNEFCGRIQDPDGIDDLGTALARSMNQLFAVRHHFG